ncbi:MAG: hypothetical protein HQ553_16755 [Chloroflexi bacterium]|nr:hypothetical protein [Chloroflexota bacterium]
MKKIAVSFLLLVLLLTGTAIVTPALAEGFWNTCPRGQVGCEYPGRCPRYVDTDSDGICDLSQSSPSERSEIRLVEFETQSNDTSEAVISVNNNEAQNLGSIGGGSGLDYRLLPIILLVSLLYGLSHLLSSKRIIKRVVHRKIWNFVLFVTFAMSAVLGLILILNIDLGMDISLPFNILYWHVEIGIVMGIVSMFHILWHWRYFTKMLKFTG